MLKLEERNGFMGLPEPHTREQSELLRDLHFVPPHLDFGLWSVGQARTQTVTLINQHMNRTVQLNSVAGPSPDFYSSFFGTREVPPQGNTTFSVVFLPRQLGAISSDLLIQTSFGRAEFAVRGEGSECPYRLKPLVGIKAPMNATLTPEIHMYNPHERPLQILEVYSSGGEFQLELPSGVAEGPQNLWEIPPHTLKPVIRISFHGRTAGKHSAYIRIKIAEQDMEQENILVIPVEFEILARHAAYARNPLADFGRLATQSGSEALVFKLDMQNEHVDPSKRLLIGSYLRDIPGLTFDANISSIVLDPKLFDKSETINDLLILKEERDEDQREFTVLVRAEIFKGGLGYDGNITQFVTNHLIADKDLDEDMLESTLMKRKRSLLVRNDFAHPLVIFNVSLTKAIDESLLDVAILSDSLPILLQPGESVELVKLNLINNEVTLKSSLHIDTNVSSFHIPLVACSGRLKVSTQAFELSRQHLIEQDSILQLDLGTVPFAEMSRNGYVILRNDNPLPIKFPNWHFSPPKNVSFKSSFGCIRAADQIEGLLYGNSTKLQYCSQLNEGDIVIFVVSIQTFVPDPSSVVLKIWTPHEVIRIEVKFRALVGQLDIEQEQLDFKSCFPGKVCSSVLSIRSSFTHNVHLQSISFTRPGLRFKDFNGKGSTIAAQTLTKVGRIYFEPSTMCGQQCYLKKSSNAEAIFPTIVGGPTALGNNNNNLLYDGVELRQRVEIFRQFKRQLQAISLTLHSEELPPLELDFGIPLEWPKLVQFQPIPPTPAIEVMQVQRQWITLNNPSKHPLLLDYFLSDPTYARRTQLSLPHEVIDVSSASCYLTDRDVFSLPEAPFGSPLLLPGSASLTIPIQFSSKTADKFCTLLHVRNNLTLYEAVWLQARAVQSQFRFGNRRPGSTTPLLFEMTGEHFKDCRSNSFPTSLVTRSFTARNSGVVPMRIDGFMIGKQSCEDYGFKVLDCQSFELGENESRKIEIAFSPDFSTSRVQRTLTLLTNLTYNINYILMAQIPAENVEACAAQLPRPSWEIPLRNAALIVLLASFCMVLLAAIFDARAIVAQQNAHDAARYRGPVQPTFNLRNIVKMQAEELLVKAEQEQQQQQQQQQQKIKNGQKEFRKRSAIASVGTGVSTVGTAPRKPKSWSTWSMDINAFSKHLQKTKAKPTVTTVSPPPVQEVQKTKTKSLTPSPPPVVTPNLNVRPQKKSKPTQVNQIPPASKPKVDILPVIPAIVNPPQPENISPKPVPINNERVLKEQNGSSVKKLGKTPGRERERKQKLLPQNGNGVASTGLGKLDKKAERKQRQKQLNFGTTATNNSSPPASPDAIKCITSPWETSSRVSFRDVLQTNATLTNLDNGNQWSPPLLTSELGPIGDNRKSGTPPDMSPLVTNVSSMWEPLEASSSNSLFANMDRELPAQVVNDLYERSEHERKIEREQQSRSWERSELIMKQQMLLKQLELEQQEKLLLLATMEQQQQQQQQPNWTTSWSPLAYANWTNPANSSPSHSSSVGPIRPPPGLESNLYNRHSPINSTVQPTHNAMAPNGVPTQYDPFTSPSSIWSDNWRQSSQLNNNNNMN
ncbi:uncharacterized protein Dwil_GK10747 [Drosophila willistoni]|uniref:Uncharacterized protein n=1 Tax=Drosophila willistoni TaxID=7260 RepID=B4MIX6_DROWI|nr:uncharacterized protein Dwil_GK10747 [Drosophila willistoni]